MFNKSWRSSSYNYAFKQSRKKRDKKNRYHFFFPGQRKKCTATSMEHTYSQFETTGFTVILPSISNYGREKKLNFPQTSISLFGWDAYWYVLTVLIFLFLGYLLARNGGRLQPLVRYQKVIFIFIIIFSLSVGEILIDLLIHKNIKNQWEGSWIILALNLIFYVYLIWPRLKKFYQ